MNTNTYSYCLGFRINDVFQERVCENRKYCNYYRNVKLSVAFSNPETYIELDTYNNIEPCPYFDETWKKDKTQCETSDMQTDGMTTLWSKDS